MVFSGAVVLGLWLWDPPPTAVAAVASTLGCLHLSLIGIFVATDVDGQARALRALTRPWSLLRPGAVRGFRFIVLLVLGWTGLCMGLYFLSVASSTSSSDAAMAHVLGMLAAPAYAILYLSLPLVVGRLPRSDQLASPAVVRVLFFALAGLAGALLPLLAVLFDQRVDDPLVNLLNPFIGIANFSDYNHTVGETKMSPGLLACVWLVAALAAFTADRALVERERRAHAS
jgi:hypothetical protein